MQKENVLFAAKAFSIFSESIITYANILKEQAPFPLPAREKISEFALKANFLKKEVIQKYIYDGNSLEAMENVSDLIGLVLNLTRQGDDGLKKLALISSIIADDDLQFVDEQTHFVQKKRTKK